MGFKSVHGIIPGVCEGCCVFSPSEVCDGTAAPSVSGHWEERRSTLVLASMMEPLSRSSFTMLLLPRLDATWRGVMSFYTERERKKHICHGGGKNTKVWTSMKTTPLNVMARTQFNCY